MSRTPRRISVFLLAIVFISATAIIAKSAISDYDYDAGLYSYSKVYGFLESPYSPGSAASYHYVVNTASLEQVTIVAFAEHISDTAHKIAYGELNPNEYMELWLASTDTVTLIAKSYARVGSETGPIDSYARVSLP